MPFIAFNDAICSSNHCLTNITHAVYFCWVWSSDFNLTLRKCRLKKNRQRKGLQKQKRQVLPVVVPEAKTGEFILPLSFLLLSFLLCSFCPEFFSSPISLFPIMLFLTSPLLVFLHLFLFANTSFYRLCALHSPTIFSPPVTLSLCCALFIPNSSLSFSLPLQFHHSPFSCFSFCCSFYLLSSLLTANVCDEEMLLCQNGGTCYQNQKCICPPEFKGVLCQHSRCEAGKDCNTASSLHLSTATLLLCTLLAHLLATLTPHWAKKTPLRPRSVCLCVCVREARGDPVLVGPPQLWTRWTHTTALEKHTQRHNTN